MLPTEKILYGDVNRHERYRIGTLEEMCGFKFNELFRYFPASIIGDAALYVTDPYQKIDHVEDIGICVEPSYKYHVQQFLNNVCRNESLVKNGEIWYLSAKKVKFIFYCNNIPKLLKQADLDIAQCVISGEGNDMYICTTEAFETSLDTRKIKYVNDRKHFDYRLSKYKLKGFDCDIPGLDNLKMICPMPLAQKLEHLSRFVPYESVFIDDVPTPKARALSNEYRESIREAFEHMLFYYFEIFQKK